MILQLTPEQTVSRWDYLEPIFVQTLPEKYRDEQSAVSMLKAILMEDCQVWQVTDDETDELKAYAITEIREDVIVGVRRLFLYLLVGQNIASLELWTDSLRALKSYARSRGCISIQAVTVIDEVAHLASRLGSTNQQLLEFGVI